MNEVDIALKDALDAYEKTDDIVMARKKLDHLEKVFRDYEELIPSNNLTFYTQKIYWLRNCVSTTEQALKTL